jgi:hypothetical protein
MRRRRLFAAAAAAILVVWLSGVVFLCCGDGREKLCGGGDVCWDAIRQRRRLKERGGGS